MKSTLTFISIVLFISTLFLPYGFAQDYTRWELPEGAKLRLGKGKLNNTVGRSTYQFSPDSNQLAVFTSIGVWIYDVQTGKEIRLLTEHKEGWIDDTALSLDFQTLASPRDSWEHHEIRLWDTHTGKIKTTLEGHRKRVNSVVFSPEGQVLASSDLEGVIRLWNIRTGTHRMITTPHKSVNVVAFSPDGQTIMSREDRDFRLWDPETGQLKTRLEDTKQIETITFSPNGQLLVGANNKEIRLWDVSTGKIKTKIKNSVWNNPLAFSPDGKTLAHADGNDYTVQLRDSHTGKLKNTFSGDPEYIKMTQISPDGTPKEVDYATKPVYAIAFSPDGGTLAVASDGEIRLWDVDTGIHKATFRGLGLFYDLVFSPDGRTLAVRNDPPRSEIGIFLWDIDPTDIRKSEIRCVLTDHKLGVNSIVFSPNGQFLASGHKFNNIRLWDVERGKLELIFKGHSYPLWIQSVAFAPNGETLASLSISIQSSDHKAEILLWDAATGEYITTLIGHDKAINNSIPLHSSSIAFSPDGKILASGSLDGTVRLWDPNTAASDSFLPQLRRAVFGYHKGTIRAHTSHVLSVALSPDGRTLASGSSNQTVRLWDLRSRKLKASLKEHRAAVKCVTFSPDGRTLASGDEQGGIYLWDPNTTDRKALLMRDPHANDVINALAFSPDGATLASGGSTSRPGGNWTGGVFLWNMETHHLKKTLIGHKSWVHSVAFSPDGRTLASGSADGTILIWELEP